MLAWIRPFDTEQWQNHKKTSKRQITKTGSSSCCIVLLAWFSSTQLLCLSCCLVFGVLDLEGGEFVLVSVTVGYLLGLVDYMM
jgi:hypothetical protein